VFYIFRSCSERGGWRWHHLGFDFIEDEQECLTVAFSFLLTPFDVFIFGGVV